MADLVQVTRAGDIAVLTLNDPPHNALTQGLCRALDHRIDQTMADTSVRSVVIMGRGRGFASDVPLTAPDTLAATALSELCLKIENAPKASVAVLHGVTVSAGLELALACHARVAAPSAKMGFPDVRLGGMPEAGGTQRLPRVIGGAQSVSMFLNGRLMRADQAHKIGLVDAVVEDKLLARAVTLAHGLSLRPTRRRTDAIRHRERDNAALANARSSAENALTAAPLAVIDCVETALRGEIADGFAQEARLAAECHSDPRARALRHLFVSRARAAAPMTALEPAPFDSLGLSCGMEAVPLAVHSLRAGVAVTVHDGDAGRLSQILAAIRDGVDAANLPQQLRDACLVLLSGSQDAAAMAHAEVIVSDAEHLPVKEGGAVVSDALSSPNALSVGGMISGKRLWEIKPRKTTSDTSVATMIACARRLSVAAIVLPTGQHSMLDRLELAWLTAADHLLEAGAAPAQIDAALTDFGVGEGPYTRLDRLGLSHGVALRDRLGPQGQRSVGLTEALVTEGFEGQAMGHGFYVWNGGERISESPAASAQLDHIREARGIAPRTVSDIDIVDYCLTAIQNTAIQILADGGAHRAGDIDYGAVTHLDLPTTWGGPIFAAETEGLGRVLTRIWTYGTDDPTFWQPAAPLEHAVAQMSDHLILSQD